MKWLVFALLFQVVFLTAQTNPVSDATIDSLITEKKYDTAQRYIQSNITYYSDIGPLDSLYKYPHYVGKIALAKTDAKTAERDAINFIEQLKIKTSSSRILYKAYLSLDKLYLDLRDDTGSVKAATQALEYANKTKDITDEELGRIYYILGGNYYALYDDPNALKNFRKSIYHYEKSPTVKKYKLADSYNGAATGLWVLNMLDSAEVYYKRAIDIANKSDLQGYHKDYYIAGFEYNLALVIDDQGRVSDAVAIEKDIIKTFQEIIRNANDEELVTKAKRLEAGAIANLAAFYNDIGYIDRAYDMVKYSYEKKKAIYDPNDPNLIAMLNKIAGAEVNLRQFDKSLETLAIAAQKLQQANDPYPTIEAEVYLWKAKAYEGKNNPIAAETYFKKSDSLFKSGNPDAYSRGRLRLLRNYSQFLAAQNNKAAAVSKAREIYNYIIQNADEGNIVELKEIVNLAQIYLQLKNYKNALSWANKADTFIEEKLSKSTNALDSLQIEYRRPNITYLQTKSIFELEAHKTVPFISDQIKKINKAVAALERRRSTIIEQGAVAELLSEYNNLNTLSKLLHYELYKLTGDFKLIDDILSLQESGVYHRIRTKLNSQQEIKFNNIPQSILDQENQLKQDVSWVDKDTNFNIVTYFEAQKNWTDFLDVLRKEHPAYYTMKYASLEVPTTDLQSKIPANTTLLRYLFIEEDLFVLVISPTQKKLVKLRTENLSELIKSLSEDWEKPERVSVTAHKLYEQLWQPIAPDLKTEHIMIVPDGVLYNLSFEMLTASPIATFSEFATKSILSKHTIAYNFSAVLVDKEKTNSYFDKNYVGFAPEFTQEMKDGYTLEIRDSLDVDKTYLTLLPQPFIADVTKEYSRRFNGNSFLNENASKTVFLKNAKEHKIIHIGTHSESNNLYPELSRLIFAKNSTTDRDQSFETGSNSLYTYEIYNANLSANLAILTACETGKPEFQPGEGMISLAHAFTYAGSESILTSLWQIDELSSSQIVRLFYENLQGGMSKDKALQQAKLTYISNAKSRTAAPQYWAGLVLIGDTSPIELSTSYTVWYWIAGACLIVLLYLGYKRLKT